MTKRPHGLAAVNRLYGTPYTSSGTQNRTWYQNNMVRYTPPWKMRLAWDLNQNIGSFLVHRLVVPNLHAAMTDCYNYARILVKHKHGFDHSSEFYNAKTQELMRHLHLDRFGGVYNFRKKRGSNSYSTHSWGIAIDIDPARNGMGNHRFALPLWFAERFEYNGFVWGGRWSGRSVDAMHFQLASGI